MLHTSSLVDSLSLSGVFGHVGVDEVNQIESDWGAKNEWVTSLGGDLAVLVIEDTHNRSCCAHF